jgi:hypothetical protein
MARRRNLFMMLAGLTSIPLFAVKAIAAGTLVPDDFLTRLEAVALVQTLNGELLASRSATLTLDRWCKEHGLAGVSEAKIVARSTAIKPKKPTDDQRHGLAGRDRNWSK